MFVCNADHRFITFIHNLQSLQQAASPDVLTSLRTTVPSACSQGLRKKILGPRGQCHCDCGLAPGYCCCHCSLGLWSTTWLEPWQGHGTPGRGAAPWPPGSPPPPPGTEVPGLPTDALGWAQPTGIKDEGMRK